MVRKRKREEDKSGVIDTVVGSIRHEEVMHDSPPIVNIVVGESRAPSVGKEEGAGGDGDKGEVADGGDTGGTEERKNKKRNLHGRYKKKKVIFNWSPVIPTQLLPHSNHNIIKQATTNL